MVNVFHKLFYPVYQVNLHLSEYIVEHTYSKKLIMFHSSFAKLYLFHTTISFITFIHNLWLKSMIQCLDKVLWACSGYRTMGWQQVILPHPRVLWWLGAGCGFSFCLSPFPSYRKKKQQVWKPRFPPLSPNPPLFPPCVNIIKNKIIKKRMVHWLLLYHYEYSVEKC